MARPESAFSLYSKSIHDPTLYNYQHNNRGETHYKPI